MDEPWKYYTKKSFTKGHILKEKKKATYEWFHMYEMSIKAKSVKAESKLMVV